MADTFFPDAALPGTVLASTVLAGSFPALCADEPELATLRDSLREFLAADISEHRWQPAVDAWLSRWDESFSARLGAAGFLGLTIPREYGGRGLGHLHRYVVAEELLAAGAPVAAHWIADRQVGPALLSYGNEEQRQRILPKIAAGRYFSAIGMSEPQAGSDLAAASARATRTDGGWLLSGTKVWTSGAHLAHQIVVLARTSPPDPAHRHAGFSQFIVPTDSGSISRGGISREGISRGGISGGGIAFSPIVLMSGEHHFNEITFDEVFIDDTNLLGQVGDGWRQVTAELSFERSGPERILTTAPLLTALVRTLSEQPDTDDRTAAAIGELVARLVSLRQLSVSVARALADGQSQVNQAALVKDLGTRFEQESVELAADLLSHVPPESHVHPGSRTRIAELLEAARLHSPLFTLRGGTNEVLRGMVAKGMGLR